MRTLSDLEAAFEALERRAVALSGDHEDLAIASPVARRSSRRRTALATVAAIVVGATAAGGSYLWSRDRGSDDAGGAPTPLCVAAPLGRPSSAVGIDFDWMNPGNGAGLATHTIDASGQVLYWGQSGTALTVQYYDLSKHEPGEVAGLQVPAGETVWSVVADDRSVVVELAPPTTDGAARVNVDVIDLIDRKSGAVTNLLSNAPIPAGFSSGVGVGGSWATLQDGTFYWLEDAGYDDAPKTLMSYDVAQDTYQATPTNSAAVYLNALGISWDGGSIPVKDLPPVHPPVDLVRQTVAFDGNSLAWSTYDDPGTLHWSDGSGDSRTLSQDLMSHVNVVAVGGPYVFLDHGEGDDADQVNGDVYVVDTRTGAIADTGITSASEAASGGDVVAINDEVKVLTVRMIAIGGLPRLTCKAN